MWVGTFLLFFWSGSVADVSIAFNPARCMGLMVAKGEMQYHYVHWLGPLAASMVNGMLYHLAPPYVRDKPLREVARTHV